MRVAVIGSGSWGTACTGLVSPHADEVVLWALEENIAEAINRDHANPVYLSDYRLEPNVSATSSLKEALAGADAAIFASPSAFLRRVCSQAAPYLAKDAPVLVLSKGIELGSNKLMHEVAADELGNPERVAALSGPNHAEEIAKGVISAAAIASLGDKTTVYFQELLNSPTFRAYASDDIVGIETCGAVKNVIAIACGIAAGLGAGDNTLAVLMTRGVAEISRIVCALGGQALTCMGLAGMGDLVVTCTSKHSRNRSFGQAFVEGESLDEYQARTRMVVEGAQAAKSVHALAGEKGIEVPITNAVHALLYEGVSIQEGVSALTSRIPHEEFYGLG